MFAFTHHSHFTGNFTYTTGAYSNDLPNDLHVNMKSCSIESIKRQGLLSRKKYVNISINIKTF